jgi:hypothetical protein
MNTTATRSLLVGSIALAALASTASAQVQLIAGWNFGQFISAGVPSTDGTTGDPVSSIPSNYSGSNRPTDADSGPAHIGAGDASTYSSGTGVLSFTAWDFAGGTDVSVVELGSFSAVNETLVTGQTMFAGDPNNAHLRFTAGSVTDFTITVNTSGFDDFDPSGFSQTNDANMTLALYKASGASASIEWLYNGTPFGTTSTTSGSFTAFTLDLPASFYGNTSAVITGRVTGDLVIDHLQINAITAVPEPSSYAALAAVAGLALAVVRRRRA